MRKTVHLPELDSQLDLLIGSDIPESFAAERSHATGGGSYAKKVNSAGRKTKHFLCTCYFTKSLKVHPMCVVFSDFVNASSTDGPGLSHHDLKFKNIVENSTQFQGMSLNSELLQGPYLTNSLVGLLLCFCQDPVL